MLEDLIELIKIKRKLMYKPSLILIDRMRIRKIKRGKKCDM